MTFLFLEFILSKERRYFQIYIYIHAFRYNFSWEIKYSLYSQEFRNSEKRTGYSLWKFWFCFLKKFAIHKKTTGYYCLWKFWFSLLSRNSQFTKNQQGTPFEKKEDFDSFLVEVESVCHQNIDKVNKRRPILHDIATGRLDDLETTHGDIINLTRVCKKLE